MGETIWLKKAVGGQTQGPAYGGYVQLWGDDTPDEVRLPPDLGGGVRRVLKVSEGQCPCGSGHRSRLTLLDGGLDTPEGHKALCVAECDERGEFLWFALPLVGRAAGDDEGR